MYTYDFNGNTLTKANSSGTTTYAWDFENRLTSVTLPSGGGAVTFKYDSFGRRIQKTAVNGTSAYLYDGWNSIAELNGSGAVASRYAQGEGVDEVLVQVRSGTTMFYDVDGTRVGYKLD